MATDLYADIARLSQEIVRTTDPDQRARMNKDLHALADRLPKASQRRAEFIEDVDDRRSLELRVRNLYSRPARNDQEHEAAKFLDEAVILSACLHNRDPRSTRFWHEGLQERPWLQKALDTSTGADWIPTEVSADLAAQVRLETRVVALLNNVQMPTPVYKLPVGGNPPRAHLIPETSGADDYLDSTKLIPASEPVIGAKAILTARKVGVRCVPSVELVEDSVIPMSIYPSRACAVDGRSERGRHHQRQESKRARWGFGWCYRCA